MYFGPCQTSPMDLLWENCYQVLFVNYFSKRAPSKIFAEISIHYVSSSANDGDGIAMCASKTVMDFKIFVKLSRLLSFHSRKFYWVIVWLKILLVMKNVLKKKTVTEKQI